MCSVRLFDSKVRWQRFWVGIVLLCGCGCGLWGLLYWRRGSTQAAPLLESLPQDPNIQVYFNHSQAAAYTEPYRQQYRLGDNLEQMVIEAISTAQHSIDVAAHELNLPQIAMALSQRHQAGIKVRLIVENTYRQPLSQIATRRNSAALKQLDSRQRQKYEHFFQFADQNQNGQLEAAEIAVSDAMAILQAAKVPILDDTADGSKGSDLMHHKFIVIDEQTVISGSANLTWSDIHGDFSTLASQGNANHLLKIHSSAVAKLYGQEFNLMWGKGRPKTSQFGLKKPARAAQTITLPSIQAPNSQVTVQFSPTSTKFPWAQSVNGLIGRSLGQAQRSIDLALFVFSDQQLSNQLETESRQGTQIRALIEPSFAYRDYSEGLDLLGLQLTNAQCRYEAQNRPWKSPITTLGIPQLAEGDLLHHKFAVIDAQTVITGSQNWSDAANHSNDENLLVIRNPTVAAHFQREFSRLYDSAILGLSPTLQNKLQQQRQKCQK
jgi:phosphatidylserine/phosphatidylglycerophosphate/cardiolipin synthase-like enzyme